MTRRFPRFSRIYQCSECAKSYLKWRWCAKHISRKHDGAAVIEEHPVSGSTEGAQR